MSLDPYSCHVQHVSSMKMENSICENMVTSNCEIPFQKQIINLKITSPCSHSNSNISPFKDNCEIRKCNHEKKEYCLHCSCSDCLQYKRDLIIIAQDHFITAEIWNELKLTIRNYYKSIFGNIANNDFEQYFSPNKNRWQSCGILNHTKSVLSRSHFDLTDEMKIALHVALLVEQASNFEFRNCPLLHKYNVQLTQINVVTKYCLKRVESQDMMTKFVLHVDNDSHQLLELLSSEIDCLIRIYAKGISFKFGESIHGDTALHKINYVIDGYVRITAIAAKVESIMFGFQSNYLNNFSFSWTLLNKRLYQKLVYTKFSDVAIHYLSKLKKEVAPNIYIEILSKYLRFDDEMLVVKQTWKRTWDSLNKYHMSSEDAVRRERIRTIHVAFEHMQKLDTDDCHQLIEIEKWASFEDPNMIWYNVIAYIKNKWQKNTNQRISATIRSDKCVSCKTPTDNHKT